MPNAYQRFCIRLVDISRRAAFWIVGGAFCSAAILLAYIPTHLSLDTDPLKLLDPSLPFRQQKTDYQRMFPQLTKLIMVVIDSQSPDDAEMAGDSLAKELGQHPDRFLSVYQPGQDPFFKRQGLLFMKIDDLLKLDERLAQWAPFLETMVRDPSLRGLFSVLGPALGKIRRLAEEPSLGDIFSPTDSPSDNSSNMENQKRFTHVLEWIGETIKAQIANVPNSPFWRETILDGLDSQGNDYRRFLLVKPRLDYSSLEAFEDPLNMLVSVSESIENQYQVQIRLTGDLILQEEERKAVSKGAGLAALLAFGLVCLILMRGLGSLRLAVSIGFTLLLGLLWTAGFATVAIGTLNMISSTAPVLFIGLGVDFGIQFVLRYREAREGGLTHELALRQTASGVSGALTLAAVAAAVSFFSFLPTSYRGLAELGIISGAGMFLALLANLTLLPAFLTLFPVKFSPLGHSSDLRLHLMHSILRHRRAILLTTVVLLGGAAAILPRVSFDFNPLHLKDPSTEGVATFLELLHDPNMSPYAIHVLVQDLAAAQKLSARLESLREVKKTMTLASFVPGDQEEKLALIEEMHFSLEEILNFSLPIASLTREDNLNAFYAFQDKLALQPTENLSSDLVASAKRLDGQLDQLKALPGWPDLVLDELQIRLLETLPKVQERLRLLLTASRVRLEDLPHSLKERFLAPDGRVRLVIFPSQDMSENYFIKNFVRAVQPIAPSAFGPPVGLIGAGDAVVKSCVQATGLALFCVTLLLLLVLRHFGETLLVLLPLILTIILTLAISVVVELPLNLANVIALPLVLGLGIAFGIYLVMRVREGIRVSHLFQSSTFRAVWYSALTTIASFGVLSIAEHRGMSSMGLLLTLSLVLTLLCSLVILPAVLAELESRGLWSSGKNSDKRIGRLSEGSKGSADSQQGR